ncbi:antibiotic ABC transporter permease [Halosolutus halophilus]|uniref:antibiotic ABC transporter permease n=1 Tax=Halosolutus halophilus TaxID=1552990 RepID=UPI0022351D17|nr:antibiotic ABC transporter permease [Halosolutus halophilus]
MRRADTPGESVTETHPLDRYVSVLDATLEYARERDYAGPDYGDGMSSKLLAAVPIENRWLNLAVQEVVKRAPMNVRPLLRVEHRRNYKGVALFSMANLNYHVLSTTDRTPTPDFDPLVEAEHLVEWLLDEQCTGYSGFCGGHRHEIQHMHCKGVPNDADIVSTTYAVKALLRAARVDGGDQRYAAIARSATWFLIEDLNYREVPEGAKIDYHMNHPEDSYTLNAAALGAQMLVDLYEYFGDEQLRDRATKILDHVAAQQTDLGGWPYRIPADASHLSMDNHHNGFIIESFQRYRDVIDADRYAETLDSALEFYRTELFEPNGAPNFDERNAYPRDIHASTQGLLVFTREGDLEFAERILQWVLENLQVLEGQFYYRKYRFHTKRVTLMRWCQAWMAYALSEFLLASETPLEAELDRSGRSRVDIGRSAPDDD